MNIKNTFLALAPWLGPARSVETCAGVQREGRLASRAVRAWRSWGRERRTGRWQRLSHLWLSLHWQRPRMASGGEHRGSLPPAFYWGSGSELNQSQAEKGRRAEDRKTNTKEQIEGNSGNTQTVPNRASQASLSGSPPARDQQVGLHCCGDPETGNTFFFCGLNAWLCLFAFSICYAVALKSEAGWILLVVLLWILQRHINQTPKVHNDLCTVNPSHCQQRQKPVS